jgi:hypothetical protein
VAADENVREVEVHERDEAAEREIGETQAGCAERQAGHEKGETLRGRDTGKIEKLWLLNDEIRGEYREDGRRGGDYPTPARCAVTDC